MISLDTIYGNADLVRTLKGMVSSGRVPHAIMLYENDGCGAMEIALALLSALGMDSGKVSKLIHPDVHFVYPVSGGSKVSSSEKPSSQSYLQWWRPLVSENPYFLEKDLTAAFGIEGKNSFISVEEARIILEKLSFTSLEGGYRAIVVYLPERMNEATANRLLKSIEEPPEMTQFIFITHAPEKVLTTISSRCQGIRVLPMAADEVAHVLQERFSKSHDEAMQAAQASGGSVGVALDILSDSEDRDAEMDLFDSMMRAICTRNLPDLLDVSEELASLPSREKAKAFCKFASDQARKIFMVQQGMEQIAGLTDKDRDSIRFYASKVRRSFTRESLGYLDRARMLIDRNINLKVMFCDLVDKLYCIA